MASRGNEEIAISSFSASFGFCAVCLYLCKKYRLSKSLLLVLPPDHFSVYTFLAISFRSARILDAVLWTGRQNCLLINLFYMFCYVLEFSLMCERIKKAGRSWFRFWGTGTLIFDLCIPLELLHFSIYAVQCASYQIFSIIFG